MMQTNLGNGETISVGAACMATFFAGALTAMLSDAPPEALNSLSAVLTPLSAIIGPDEWVAGSDPVEDARAEPTSKSGPLTADEIADLEWESGHALAEQQQETGGNQ